MKNAISVPLLIIACLVVALGCNPSRIVIADPPVGQESITTPHDLVVAHYGCGTSDSGSLEAFLDEGEANEIDISEHFEYDHESCMNDVVQVSQTAVLGNYGASELDEGGGCDTIGLRLSMKDGGCATFLGHRPRYVSVKHPDTTYLCYGKGDVPSHYRVPYTIRIYKDGDVYGDFDCVDSKPPTS